MRGNANTWSGEDITGKMSYHLANLEERGVDVATTTMELCRQIRS